MSRRIFLICTFLFLTVASFSQESKDSLVRLISGGRARLIESPSGEVLRMVERSEGKDVVFFHNNTRLVCDTARWNVTDGFIDAIGHIHIVQGETRMTGDRIHYISARDLAEFRGSLVQLENDVNNILRTHHLDYNTRDSVALFFNGASMKDEDGNVIESREGSYDSKTGIFVFRKNVEMYSDSLFFRTDRLVYDSKKEIAYFYGHTRAWKGNNHLSSEDGWYNLKNETLEFKGKIYVLNLEHEAWCEKAFYEKALHNLDLYDDIQVLDTVNKMIVTGNRLRYEHSPRKVFLEKDPVLIAYGLEDPFEAPDSAFIAADRFLYEGVPMCDVDSLTKAIAKERLDLTKIDPFAEVRQKAQENKLKNMKKADRPVPPVRDSLAKDSLPVQQPVQDSLKHDAVPRDSLVRDSLMMQRDTTLIDFLRAFRNVRMYKNDIQIRCDSLEYTSLDSISRLYLKPIIWYENQNQMTADSVQFTVKNQALDKGYLMSNAFVVTETEENGKYYNQIKSPEMVGYFVGGALSRMDALGGVSALFFFAEKDEISTVNMKETRMMSASLVDGSLQRILNVENLKNDAHPVYELTEEQVKLRGFSWQIDKKINTRFDITDKRLKKSIRNSYIRRPIFPRFRYTSIYFEDYLDGVMLPVAARSDIKWKKTKL